MSMLLNNMRDAAATNSTASETVNNISSVPTPWPVLNGWLQADSRVVRQLCSPNFNARPQLAGIRLIVLHNISLPPAQFGGGYIEQFFQNQLDRHAHPYFQTIADLKVSTHLLILRTGEIIQLVSFDDRAWHAGRSSYLGVEECNDYSIGIELEGTDDVPFTQAQYQALLQAMVSIQQAYPATRQHMTGHSDIAPGRKTDPGDCLDWQRIRHDLAEFYAQHA